FCCPILSIFASKRKPFTPSAVASLSKWVLSSWRACCRRGEMKSWYPKNICGVSRDGWLLRSFVRRISRWRCSCSTRDKSSRRIGLLRLTEIVRYSSRASGRVSVVIGLQSCLEAWSRDGDSVVVGINSDFMVSLDINGFSLTAAQGDALGSGGYG